jgi:prevent-host-death family protein
MVDVSIRDLPNKGGEVVDRASRGEPITITKAGRRVAELRSLRQRGLAASVFGRVAASLRRAGRKPAAARMAR